MARVRKGATRLTAQKASTPSLLRWLPLALLLSLGVAVLAWGTSRLLDPASFPVTTVRIETPLKHIGKEAVREVIRPHVKQGFIGVDVGLVRKELEALPWVAQASVRRSWPDRLVVNIQEQQAVARWSSGGLLSVYGELFKPERMEQWNNLPLLRGPKNTEKVLMDEYKAMQGMLKPLGLRISHLTMNERRAWSLYLDNGLQLSLGRNDTHVRLLRFVRVYARVLHPRLETIDSIDLRYTNGFAVRWREDAAAAA